MAQHIDLGQWGEEIACKYLENKGYIVLDRNFRRKWGEIDIVCSFSDSVPPALPVGRRGTSLLTLGKTASDVVKERDKTLLGWFKGLFSPKKESLGKNPVDKQISFNKLEANKIIFIEVKTLQSSGGLRPEDNVTRAKQKKLIRSCQLYISQKRLPINTDWQIDVVGVLLDKKSGKAKIEHIKQAIYFN